VFFGKKVDVSSMQGALCILSVFFYILLIGGGAYAPNAPPAYGPAIIAISQQRFDQIFTKFGMAMQNGLLTALTAKKIEFQKSNMADGCHLKKTVNSLYLRSTDLYETR